MEGHTRRARKSGDPRQIPPGRADLTSRALQSNFIPLKCYQVKHFGLRAEFLESSFFQWGFIDTKGVWHGRPPEA